jgi:tRNA(His) guanylyltransferase
MANSKFSFVKKFEQSRELLPSIFMVVRLDGRGFTKFCESLGLEKPNDVRALNLMNSAAREVMDNFHEIVLGFGESDEYSFVFKKNAKLFNRREDKILSCVLSLFSSSYMFHFKTHFPDINLQKIPSFDARIVLYPSIEDLKAYLSWR